MEKFGHLVARTDGKGFKNVVLGLQVRGRNESALAIQKCLTDFGCSITSRVGIHETNPKFCSPYGLIILTCAGDEGEVDAMEKALGKVPGVTVGKIEFDVV